MAEEGATAAVRRRLVVVLPGFEALPPVAHARRFLRDAKAACGLYGLGVSRAEGIHEPHHGAVISMTAPQSGTETVTEIVFCDLDGALGPLAERGIVARFVSGFAALADFLFSGTVLRYARTGWRFVLFYLFPPSCLLLAALAGWLGAVLVGLLAPTPAATIVAAALFAIMALWVAIRWLRLPLALDLWSFAADLARDRDRRVAPALDRLEDAVSRRIAQGGIDELVIAGHSIGAVPAVGLAARIARGGACRPYLLTVGSTLLQVALHPAAGACRADIAEVARCGLCWLDVQSLTDPINFHRSDPVAAIGLSAPGAVNAMGVRFRTQLESGHYARIKFSPFRIHRQFVLAVERAGPYSFHAILCGPEPFAKIARRPGLPVAEPEM